jgi:hypothetical protein
MGLDDPREPDMDALIDAIWGPKAAEEAMPVDPALRKKQNHALAVALTEYLQQYLSDPSPAGTKGRGLH